LPSADDPWLPPWDRPDFARGSGLRVYTAVQLFEVLLFASIVVYALLARRPSLAVLGAGLLVGKAVLNVLAPEGGTVLRRSVLGYGLGALYVVAGILLLKLGA
jgi:hypothetical protein